MQKQQTVTARKKPAKPVQKKHWRQANLWVCAVKWIFFFGVLMAMGTVGLLWFMRPNVSMLEKRELSQFPELTWNSFWDGSYFKAIDIWYADTYPLREPMIAVSQRLKSLYGIRSEQIVGEPQSNEPKAAKTATATATEVEEVLPDGTVHAIGEMHGKIYITGNAGYELYYFLEDNNTAFVATMNGIYRRVGSQVNLYVLVVPTSAAVMLSKEVLEDMECSDEEAAVDFIVRRLDPGIHGINAVKILKQHNAEYLYFHTDHHWTARGAYYAYVAFCREKGIEPHKIDDYEAREFPGFLGTFYSSSGRSPELEANPDTVFAYPPKGTNDMQIMDPNGEMIPWHIVSDASPYERGELYLIFVGGDNPFSMAHNTTITDGSAVLLIKDSMGNALVPWLVDHYEYIYWIDARYSDNTISQMVQNYHIQDVIYEASLYNASSEGMHQRYAAIGQ